MKPASRGYTIFSTIVIVLLSVFASSITRTLIIQQPAIRTELTSALYESLGSLALTRARSLDSSARWIEVEEDASLEVVSFIESSVLDSLRAQSESLLKDSNLSWLISYDGHEYRHNWKDSNSVNEGALDYTLRSSGASTTYSGAYLPAQSFSRERTILVNPALVPTERLSQNGGEYTYKLLLPADFSIHFYIPAHMESNGGTIAQIAADLNSAGMTFSMLAGGGVVIVLSLLWPWKREKDYRPLHQFTRMKAFWAWLVLAGGCAALCFVNERIRLGYASGQLGQFYQSMGLNAVQSDLSASITSVFFWLLFFFLLQLGVLYFKYIQSKGLRAYMREDSLSRWLINYYQDKFLSGFRTTHSKAPTFPVLLMAGTLVFGVVALIVLFTLLFRLGGLLISSLAAIVFVMAMIWGVYKTQNQQYQKIYSAVEQLSSGSFEPMPEEDAGIYQGLYDELRQISDSYQKALKEGLSSQISKTQLLSNVSHDLKTPITGIQTYADLMQQSEDLDEIHRYARTLQSYSSRMTTLLDDLLNVARATSGDIRLQMADIDLCELVLQMAAEEEYSLEEKGLSMVYELPSSAIVHLDPEKTARVIENLFTNICKYALENTRVYVSLHRQNERYVLTFKNISKVQMTFNTEKIVERFERGDASRHEPGSGLGLAIVKSFAEVMDGTFEVQTDADLFKAILTFPIPQVPKVPAEAETVQETASEAVLTTSEGQDGQ